MRSGIRRPATLIGAGLLVVAVLVAAAFVVRSASAQPPAGGTERWDDFRRTDGLLATPERRMLPSGQRWQIGFAPNQVVFGPPLLRIRNGTLRFDSPGAAYSWTVGDSTPRTTAVDFLYEPGGSPASTSSVGLIVSRETGPEPVDPRDGVASRSVHAGFGTDRWSVGIADGLDLRIVAAGRYQLSTDGTTRYRASMRLVDADTVEVDTPDGRTHTVSDERISDFWGPSVLIEHFQPVAGFRTDPRPVITGYAVDSDRE